MVAAPQHDDGQVLELLYLTEALGLTALQAGKKLGMSRSAALGLIKRIRDDTDKHDASPHLNGTMPPRWWEFGLRNRK